MYNGNFAKKVLADSVLLQRGPQIKIPISDGALRRRPEPKLGSCARGDRPPRSSTPSSSPMPPVALATTTTRHHRLGNDPSTRNSPRRALQFDILYIFFRHRMQKLWPFYFFIKFLCKIGQISYFLILLTTRLLNIAISQRILIFEQFIIFVEFF